MHSFCTAISENEMYGWYHTGVYGQVDGIRWSCCNENKRDSKGCRKATKLSQRPRMASLSVQRRHDSQTTPEPPTIAEELSASMPAYSSSNWGNDEGQSQDAMNVHGVCGGYLQQPDNSEERQKKKKDSHRNSIGTSTSYFNTDYIDGPEYYFIIMCEHAVSADSGFDRESKYQVGSLASLSSNQGNVINPHACMHHPNLT